MARLPTDSSEFKRFHLALTRGRPDYAPHYLKVAAGNTIKRNDNGEPVDKYDNPVSEDNPNRVNLGKKAVQPKHARITEVQAVKLLERGLNVGIEAETGDNWVIIDVDNPEVVKLSDVKPTLTTRSRKRAGYHYFYIASNPDDTRLKNLGITGVGEIRSGNQYVLTPGSWVDTFDIPGVVPETEADNAGKYTLESDAPIAHITFDELPKAFRDAIEATQVTNADADKIKAEQQARREARKAAHSESTEGKGSALFKLELSDVITIPKGNPGMRFKNPLHPGGTGTSAGISQGYLQCFSHSVTHTALSALAVLAGVADCESAGQGFGNSTVGASTVDYTDGVTLWKMWSYAIKEGILPKDDPVMWDALVWYAIDQDVIVHSDLIDGYRLPPGAVSQTKAIIKSKEGIEIINIGIKKPKAETAIAPEASTVSVSHSECFECSEEMYLKIVNEILKERKADRKFTTIFQLAKPAFLTTKTPSYTGLFSGGISPYSTSSMKSQRSRLKKAGIIDEDGLFTLSFFNDYVRKFNEKRTTKERLDAMKKDSRYFEDITVELGFDYENTMDVIRMNQTVVYHLPELPVKKLDYFDTYNIQIIKMNHVGGNPVVQLPLSYHYRCGACGYETDLAFDVKSLPCSNTEGCKGGTMGRVKSQDIIRPAFASRVVTDDLNSISIISLSEIPQGEFIGAVFLCRNKADYHLFMIATEEIEPSSSTVSIESGKHAIWQLIDMIDQQHEDRIGTHIHGMDWYKAAILMAYLANCKGRVSTNCLIVGDPGVGKTSTPRFYIATLTPQQKVIDAMQLTGPGLHGSMAQIKIGDSTINVPEAGLLVRHRLVVIDELLENRNSLMPQLKSALMSSTISREVAGNRTQTPKYATAIATSNPVPAVLMEQIKWMNGWIEAEGGVKTSIFEEHPAKNEMIKEWTRRGVEWRTGQSMADMDRYPLIFFVRDPSDEVSDFDLGGEDMEIDDLRLAKLLYDSDINEYFSFCGRLKVDWKSQNVRIIELVRELRERDKIHSKKRLGQNITLMLQLSAQINGRCDLTDEDFDFVRELWSRTCDWIDVSQLSHESSDKTYPSTEWNIERIKKAIHEGMKEYKGLHRYWMTGRGFAMIADKLEAQGAPSGLVEDTIERFKQNPDQ